MAPPQRRATISRPRITHCTINTLDLVTEIATHSSPRGPQVRSKRQPVRCLRDTQVHMSQQSERTQDAGKGSTQRVHRR